MTAKAVAGATPRRTRTGKARDVVQCNVQLPVGVDRALRCYLERTGAAPSAWVANLIRQALWSTGEPAVRQLLAGHA